MAISWDMPIPGFHVSYAVSLHEVLEDRVTASLFLFHVRGGGDVCVCVHRGRQACVYGCAHRHKPEINPVPQELATCFLRQSLVGLELDT